MLLPGCVRVCVCDHADCQWCSTTVASWEIATLLNVQRSAIVPLPLPHRLSGTVYPRTCGRQHHCQCSGAGWRPSFTDAHSALDTLCDWHFFLTWPCSCLTLRHVKRNSFIIINNMNINIIIIVIIFFDSRYQWSWGRKKLSYSKTKTLLGFTITMVKTIVFAIIIIRLHHYHGEDYCFCHYYYSFFFFLPKRSLSDKHETCTGMDHKWT